jgi:miniconductance mechanosensitive channel
MNASTDFWERFDIWTQGILQSFISDHNIADITRGFLYIILIILLCVILNYLVKKLIGFIGNKLIGNSSGKYGQKLVDEKVFHKLSHLAPVLVIFGIGPVLLNDFPKIAEYTSLLTDLYIVVMMLMLVYALLNAFSAIYDTFAFAASRPIKIYVQITKIITGLFAGIIALSLIMGKSPLYYVTGMGAAMAILMLVFKDTILGFVGGVQVTANNMVQIGDWIEMPKYQADGDVIEIGLHTVRVRNFDMTITTIPTYALVTDSFRNWRGMVQSGGRRIKRAIFIDAKSVKFCDEHMLEEFEKIAFLKDYIISRKKEIELYNKEHNYDPGQPVNGRRMTNLGTFRAYIQSYLTNHPHIHKEMIFMVRQLAPGEKGIPLEIYAFTNDVRWTRYEAIQSDIFDHIFAVIPYFQLRIFQYPTELNPLTTIGPVASFPDKAAITRS